MKNDLVNYFQLSMPNLTTTWKSLQRMQIQTNLTLITAHLQVKAKCSTLGH